MKFGWKVMLPIALGNIVVTALAAFIYQQMK
jgi:NADH-quinone oxidoreductase subunit H